MPQTWVTLWEPDVTVTEAVLVPAVEYVFATELPVPERPSVPVQEYAYVPVPPEAVAVHVAELPATMLAGATAQEAVRGGKTVTVAEALADPAAPVQVRV